jgi:AcrR family transcriptional regulator
MAGSSNKIRPARHTSGMAETKRLDRRSRAARAQDRETRDELVSAALRIFARRGYHQAAVDEIAADAGYSKGALYWHFSSKGELLLALLEERVGAPMYELLVLLASPPPGGRVVPEATRKFAQSLDEARDAMLLEREYWSLAIRDPELRAHYTEHQTELRDALTTMIEGWARQTGSHQLTMSAADVARLVMSIIGGLAVDELIEPGSVRPELLDEALAIVHAGLTAHARDNR